MPVPADLGWPISQHLVPQAQDASPSASNFPLEDQPALDHERRSIPSLHAPASRAFHSSSIGSLQRTGIGSSKSVHGVLITDFFELTVLAIDAKS